MKKINFSTPLIFWVTEKLFTATLTTKYELVFQEETYCQNIWGHLFHKWRWQLERFLVTMPQICGESDYSFNIMQMASNITRLWVQNLLRGSLLSTSLTRRCSDIKKIKRGSLFTHCAVISVKPPDQHRNDLLTINNNYHKIKCRLDLLSRYNSIF